MLVTLPFGLLSTLTTNCFSVKVATTLSLLPCGRNVQLELLDTQSPVKPSKLVPVDGIAFSVTRRLSKASKFRVGQLSPQVGAAGFRGPPAGMGAARRAR